MRDLTSTRPLSAISRNCASVRVANLPIPRAPGVLPFESMKRRDFITLLGATMAWPLAARAQEPPKVAKIGFLYPGPVAVATSRVQALLEGLRTVGYRTPEQIALVLRTADGDASRLAPLAAEIIASEVNVIFGSGSAAVQALRSATVTIPIIALDLESDPVAAGMAASFAHPGGNITGLFFDFPDFTPKWLEFLKEATPQLSKVAVLWDPATAPIQLKAVENAAELLRLKLEILEVSTRLEFDQAFLTARQRNADALLMLSSAVFSINVRPAAELALRYRLPAITLFPDFARVGGLMAYGPNILDTFRESGVMVGKVLTGTPPADLPIQLPTTFELVVNLQTAKALGITIPTSILVRASEVIE
jgi:putative tryptophan/tyrosine transport system substrate-binding protein